MAHGNSGLPPNLTRVPCVVNFTIAVSIILDKLGTEYLAFTCSDVLSTIFSQETEGWTIQAPTSSVHCTLSSTFSSAISIISGLRFVNRL